jgi:uncharacterized protein (DUF1499 family)
MTVRFKRRRRWVWPSIGAIGLLALFVTIDDWSRDFTENQAVMTEASADPDLRPVVFDRSADEVVHAIQEAADRFEGWEFIGAARVESSTMVVFERTSRVWRLKDDIVVRVEDLGNRCRVGGESRSRLEYGDLGQNPRNLRRIVSELRTVLGSDEVPRQPDAG